MTTFAGFKEPKQNWSRLPHQLIEQMPIMTESELKIVIYILRHTWGYGDGEKQMTIDELCNGRKRKDGSRIDAGTGLSPNSIRAGVKKAVKHGFIEVQEDNSDKARQKRFYQLATAEDLGVQNLNPRGAKFEARSEKETSRKKPTTDLETPANTEELQNQSMGAKAQNGKSTSFAPSPEAEFGLNLYAPPSEKPSNGDKLAQAGIVGQSALAEKPLDQMSAEERLEHSGWPLLGRNAPALKTALLGFLAACIRVGLILPLPSSESERGFWRKILMEHYDEYGEDLPARYQAALESAQEGKWLTNIASPKSLTTTLRQQSSYVVERGGGEWTLKIT